MGALAFLGKDKRVTLVGDETNANLIKIMETLQWVGDVPGDRGSFESEFLGCLAYIAAGAAEIVIVKGSAFVSSSAFKAEGRPEAELSQRANAHFRLYTQEQAAAWKNLGFVTYGSVATGDVLYVPPGYFFYRVVSEPTVMVKERILVRDENTKAAFQTLFPFISSPLISTVSGLMYSA